jgi:hypothetical protein
MAENNAILKNDVAKVRSVDYVYQFKGGLEKLMEVLGTTRKIPVQEGTALKAMKVTGTLENGIVAEGEIIPLSHYETEDVTVAEATLNKWRKSTTAEAIIKGGYDQAVGATTDKMVRDVQNAVKNVFFGFLATGTGEAEGATLQPALADAWGTLQTLWEDSDVDTIYFVNPTDIASYLGSAQITTQSAFGMKYVEDFLGLGTVIINSKVPAGKFYATAKENVVMYYINVGAGDIAGAFNLTTDETGYVGIHEYADNDRACVNDLVMAGVTFFPERLDGIVVGTIGAGA